MSQRLPTLFIPHGGGPCFFMEPPAQAPHLWDKMASYLRNLATDIGQRPNALLIISAHWETKHPTLNVGAEPDLLFDYYGFPEHTYQLRWDAPGETSYPSTFVLDRKGIVRFAKISRSHGDRTKAESILEAVKGIPAN